MTWFYLIFQYEMSQKHYYILSFLKITILFLIKEIVDKVFTHLQYATSLMNFGLFQILPSVKLFEISFDCIVDLGSSGNVSVADLVFSCLYFVFIVVACLGNSKNLFYFLLNLFIIAIEVHHCWCLNYFFIFFLYRFRSLILNVNY